MPYVIERTPGRFEPITGAFQSGDGNGAVNHPPEWLTSSTDEDRAEIGVHLVEAAEVPEDMLVVAIRYERIDGVVTQVLDLQPINVDQARAQAWTAAKAYRDERERAGAPTPHGFFDADIQSRANVAGAALGALRSQLGNKPFAVTFTRWDNTPVDLDADAMGAVGDAVLLYVAQVHEAGVAIRAAIEAAGDAAAVAAVDITDGYPPAAADQ